MFKYKYIIYIYNIYNNILIYIYIYILKQIYPIYIYVYIYLVDICIETYTYTYYTRSHTHKYDTDAYWVKNPRTFLIINYDLLQLFNNKPWEQKLTNFGNSFTNIFKSNQNWSLNLYRAVIIKAVIPAVIGMSPAVTEKKK